MEGAWSPAVRLYTSTSPSCRHVKKDVFASPSAMIHFGRSRQANHMRPGVRDQPGQHGKTLSFLKIKTLAWHDAFWESEAGGLLKARSLRSAKEHSKTLSLKKKINQLGILAKEGALLEPRSSRTQSAMITSLHSAWAKEQDSVEKKKKGTLGGQGGLTAQEFETSLGKMAKPISTKNTKN
ncbi:hypothetical protein AAY473_028159 [Plecturocebus cupreus]